MKYILNVSCICSFRYSKNNLNVYSISHHLAGQLVCDLNNDARSDGFAPSDCAGDPEKKRAWAVNSMKQAAIASIPSGLLNSLVRNLFTLPFSFFFR